MTANVCRGEFILALNVLKSNFDVYDVVGDNRRSGNDVETDTAI
jgi:hypothetical protein